MQKYAGAVLRVSLALVFLWFGSQQLIDAENWIGFLPGWTSVIPMASVTFVQLNGWLEVVLGTMLLVGFGTRFAAAILGLHLLGIAFTAGGAIGMRDFGLAMATLSIVLAGPDVWTLDVKWTVQQSVQSGS